MVPVKLVSVLGNDEGRWIGRSYGQAAPRNFHGAPCGSSFDLKQTNFYESVWRNLNDRSERKKRIRLNVSLRSLNKKVLHQ